jgi:cellulose biosynthesis protein BcsQ
MKVLAFFNNKGGVGKTTLAYHFSYMLSLRGIRTLVLDLDPQANLTSMFLSDDAIEPLLEEKGGTIYQGILPVIAGEGPVRLPHIVNIAPGLRLIPGDLSLSEIEDTLSIEWARGADSNPTTFRRSISVTTAFWQTIEAANGAQDDIVVLDVGPNLGAINRLALLCSDYVIVPLAPDLFSLKGLRNMGPKISEWQADWAFRRDKAEKIGFSVPQGTMQPIGYVLSRFSVRADRPAKAFARWSARIPAEFRALLGGEQAEAASLDTDPFKLATMKDYRSLMPMAMEAHKPMFSLTPADGAIGGHQKAVEACFDDYSSLVDRVLERLPDQQ